MTCRKQVDGCCPDGWSDSRFCPHCNADLNADLPKKPLVVKRQKPRWADGTPTKIEPIVWTGGSTSVKGCTHSNQIEVTSFGDPSKTFMCRDCGAMS
jgi:hypothetical protein